MPITEPICLAIVASYMLFRARAAWARRESALPFFGRFAVLGAAGWLGEETMIRVYRFYAYDVRWSVRIGHLPIVVVLVWPVVIDSAWSLARRLVTREGPRRWLAVATVAGLVVLSDAALIEPLAVRAGLWAWMEPGLFAVPVIGVLGWAFFAFFAIAWLERGLPALGALVTAPLLTHGALLASWWCAFKWVRGPVPMLWAITLLWIASLAAARRAWKVRLRDRIPLRELAIRAPAAIFFFVLLARHARGAVGARVVVLDPAGFRDPVLPMSDHGPYVIAWAIAFALPYLASMGWEKSAPSRTHSTRQSHPL